MANDQAGNNVLSFISCLSISPELGPPAISSGEVDEVEFIMFICSSWLLIRVQSEYLHVGSCALLSCSLHQLFGPSRGTAGAGHVRRIHNCWFYGQSCL